MNIWTFCATLNCWFWVCSAGTIDGKSDGINVDGADDGAVDGDAETEGFSETEGFMLGTRLGDSLGVSETEGFILGKRLGESLGIIETLGAALGFRLGAELGEIETLGDEVGVKLGTTLGTKDKVGTELGWSLGITLGESLGMLLGALLAVGKDEGNVEGCELGATVVVGAPEAVGNGDGGLELLGDAVGGSVDAKNNGRVVTVDTTRAAVSPSPAIDSSMEGFLTVDSSAVTAKRIAAKGPPTRNKKSWSSSV
jgi:hypothetical protein